MENPARRPVGLWRVHTRQGAKAASCLGELARQVGARPGTAGFIFIARVLEQAGAGAAAEEPAYAVRLQERASKQFWPA